MKREEVVRTEKHKEQKDEERKTKNNRMVGCAACGVGEGEGEVQKKELENEAGQGDESPVSECAVRQPAKAGVGVRGTNVS